jgi:hypothetical protein
MPPVVNLVDFPGYGLAVANDEMKTEWKRMTYVYVKNRPVITKLVFQILFFFIKCLQIICYRCCVLVDSTRGLCTQDRQLIRQLCKVCC